ncbi:MAG: periplasmic heavy metal sensor [Candidatus Riflebacteria bacterium]|nr:periplasmic heavy metal sensor [Candidatus Riflebacteria bacterium]
MEKTKKLSLVMIILGLMNIALLSILMWPHMLPFISNPRDQNITREADFYIEKQLKMSPDQIALFEEARHNVRIGTNKLRDQTRQVRKSLIMSIFDDPVDPAKVSRMLDELASCSRVLEEISYKHLLEVRGFCNQEQKVRLKALMVDVFKESENCSPEDS